MKKRKPWQHRTQWKGETACAQSTPRQRLNIPFHNVIHEMYNGIKGTKIRMLDVFTFEHLHTLCLFHELQLGPQAFPRHPVPMAAN